MSPGGSGCGGDFGTVQVDVESDGGSWFQTIETQRPMSTLQEVENQVASLSPGEKAELLQRVARDLAGSFPGIESTPGVCGGEPCIARTRIPVWLLEQARQLGSSEADVLRAFPTLRARDLVNAWAYVDTHREEIEQQIRENEEA